MTDDERTMKEARGSMFGRVFWAAMIGAFLGTMLAFQVSDWVS